jgi:hypothetical protein
VIAGRLNVTLVRSSPREHVSYDHNDATGVLALMREYSV